MNRKRPFQRRGNLKLPANALQYINNLVLIQRPVTRLNLSKATIDTEGAEFSLPTPLPSPSKYFISFNQIKMISVIGRGMYGIVHKVEHIPSIGILLMMLAGKIMAMKEIRVETTNSPKDVLTSPMKMIENELQILHSFKHENIVEFYGAFLYFGSVYYCMELMDAGSLDRLYTKGVPERILQRIARDVVSALYYLAQHKIIHRDVKPTNILLNTNGNVKLCDFGISGVLERSIAKTCVGAWSYMAPVSHFVLLICRSAFSLDMLLITRFNLISGHWE
jgi:mitogen-activated protein kinase kinase